MLNKNCSISKQKQFKLLFFIFHIFSCSYTKIYVVIFYLFVMNTFCKLRAGRTVPSDDGEMVPGTVKYRYVG